MSNPTLGIAEHVAVDILEVEETMDRNYLGLIEVSVGTWQVVEYFNGAPQNLLATKVFSNSDHAPDGGGATCKVGTVKMAVITGSGDVPNYSIAYCCETTNNDPVVWEIADATSDHHIVAGPEQTFDTRSPIFKDGYVYVFYWYPFGGPAWDQVNIRRYDCDLTNESNLCTVPYDGFNVLYYNTIGAFTQDYWTSVFNPSGFNESESFSLSSCSLSLNAGSPTRDSNYVTRHWVESRIDGGYGFRVAAKGNDPGTNDSKIKAFRVNNTTIYSETAVSQDLQLYSSGVFPYTQVHAVGSKTRGEFAAYTYDADGHRIWSLPLTGGAPNVDLVAQYDGRYPSYMIPID